MQNVNELTCFCSSYKFISLNLTSNAFCSLWKMRFVQLKDHLEVFQKKIDNPLKKAEQIILVEYYLASGLE